MQYKVQYTEKVKASPQQIKSVHKIVNPTSMSSDEKHKELNYQNFGHNGKDLQKYGGNYSWAFA